MRIGQKSLLVVSIPLLSQVVIVSSLIYFMHQTEAVTAEETRFQSILTQANGVTQDATNAFASLVAWRYMQSQTLLKRYETVTARAEHRLASLRELTKDQPDMLRRAENVSTTFSDLKKLGEQYRERFSGKKNPLFEQKKFSDYFDYIKDKMDRLTNDLMEFEREAEEHAVRARDLSARTRMMRDACLIGTVLSILGSVIFVVLFARQVKTRLDILARNAALFARNQPLLDAVPGDDEIADVDKAFHEMAAVVEHTKQEREDFLAMISHDLRTPLSSLKGTVTMFQEELYGPVDEDGHRRLLHAEQSITRLISLINDLVDVQRMEAGMIELDCRSVDVFDVVDQSINAVASLIEAKHLTVDLSIPEALAIDGDGKRLFQVITNLLSNAIKFSPETSTIHIVAHAHDDHVLIEVKDSGPGMTSEQLAVVFDRFRSFDTARGGTGLGLAICKIIVEAHGGQVGAHSAVNSGSTFWFTIPAHAQKEEARGIPLASADLASS